MHFGIMLGSEMNLAIVVTAFFTTPSPYGCQRHISIPFQGGLASSDAADVRNTASVALREFDATEHCQHHHPMTLRFCQAEWKGLDRDGSEVPLRPFMERLARGAAVQSLRARSGEN